jgi:hypothetical protein
MNRERRGDQDDSGLTSPLGRRAQVGGLLAVFIGVLLLFFGPGQAPGLPLNLHQMARLFIIIGASLVALGTIARWLFLD